MSKATCTLKNLLKTYFHILKHENQWTLRKTFNVSQFYNGFCCYFKSTCSSFDKVIKLFILSWHPLNPFPFFHIKEFLNEKFKNLLLKIHIVTPINHMFYVNHCWINYYFSKCVDFAKFFISSWKFIIIFDPTKIC